MKNLANCKPSEFLVQTNKIRKAVEKWLNLTNVMAIRKNMPKLIKPEVDATEEEKAKILAKNKEMMEKQGRENLSKILDQMLEEHPQETIEILALMCFIEPSEADDHPMYEYIESINELLSNKAVLGFFTSLMQLEQMDTSVASKA